MNHKDHTPKDPKNRIAYDHATAVGLVVMSTVSVICTVVMAIRHSARLNIMVVVSLLLLFLTALNRLRIRQAYRSARKNLRLIRKRHASRGVIASSPPKEEET